MPGGLQNVPTTLVGDFLRRPRPVRRDDGEQLDDLPTDVAKYAPFLRDGFDRQRQVDLAARLVAFAAGTDRHARACRLARRWRLNLWRPFDVTISMRGVDGTDCDVAGARPLKACSHPTSAQKIPVQCQYLQKLVCPQIAADTITDK
jgi:hypothetical protein